MGTVNDILTKWTLDREKVLRENYAKKNIKASGDFGKTLRHEVTDSSTAIFGNKYIGGTIYGRRPNTDQSPEGILKWSRSMAMVMSKWVQEKGGAGGWFHGFSIAKKIAKEGSSIPNKHENDGKLLTDTFTPESIDDLKNKIGRSYVAETSQITKKIFEQWRQ
jgi:hypothetical protein